MMKYKVEKNRKAPERNKYPFRHMKIGESVFIPNKGTLQISGSVQYAANKYGMKFTRRAEGKGVRVWRIKPLRK